MTVEERQEEMKREDEAEALKYKPLYYKNINSIRKNIQFFFWVTIIFIAISFMIVYRG